MHGLRYHRLYQVWNQMIQRCTNIKQKSYKDYGGRGITVCDEWLDINNFINDMYPTFKEGLTIDRIDVGGNYEKFNCRWANKITQQRNTRRLISSNKSGYRGVSFRKDTNKWRAIIRVNNKNKHLGYFTDKLKAAKVYDKYVLDNNLEHTINGV